MARVATEYLAFRSESGRVAVHRGVEPLSPVRQTGSLTRCLMNRDWYQRKGSHLYHRIIGPTLFYLSYTGTEIGLRGWIRTTGFQVPSLAVWPLTYSEIELVDL